MLKVGDTIIIKENAWKTFGNGPNPGKMKIIQCVGYICYMKYGNKWPGGYFIDELEFVPPCKFCR